MTSHQILQSLPASHAICPARVRLEHVTDWESLIAEAGYTTKGLSARCGYSIRTLQRFISGRYGECLLDFMSRVRLEKARQLLKAGYSVKEVTHSLGYKQASHFARCFKARFRMTPSDMIRGFHSRNHEEPEHVQLTMLHGPRAA